MTDRSKNQAGMTLFAVLAVMAVSAMALLAVAPAVQHEVQRQKEVESIYRGEEMAEAIRQYVEFYRGAKLPTNVDELLEGLPQGTKHRAILRASAAIDPLSEDGKWRLVQADISRLGGFARRVQNYNGGMLPANPSGTFDRWTAALRNSMSVDDNGDDDEADLFDDDFDTITDNVPFIGVASQSRNKSILTYYGIENHSKWVFTPLFRGTRTTFQIQPGTRPVFPVQPVRPIPGRTPTR
jgi:type II secretory pathway pseudopilin PulG